MRKGRLIAVALIATCISAVAGDYLARWMSATPPPTNQTGEASQGSEPFVFILDHPPVICRDGSSPVLFEIPIVNRTQATVRFNRLSCACGCTSAQSDREELQPDESTTVKMGVNLSGREGPQKFTCHWNDESGRVWTTELRVTVFRPTQFDPTSIRLGQVSSGEKISRQVHYDEFEKSVGELPPVPTFSITSIQRHEVHLDVKPPEIEQFSEGFVRRRTAIDVSLTVPTRVGYGQVFLAAILPGHGQQTSSLSIDWSVREIIEISPVRLALTFSPQDNGPQKQLVRLRPLDGQPIVIKKVTTSDSCILTRVVSAPQGSADAAEVEVSVTIPEGKRFLAGDVIVQLGPNSQEIRIPVSAVRVGFSGSVERP